MNNVSQEILKTFIVILKTQIMLEIQASSIYDAIEIAEKKNVGKLWLAYETAESQALH